ncbi:hypothetical protein AnigIFM63309_003016 [Aspergillus niger]|nr:hypothetical protein AnigIFM63309_003016 [Aspergillus niger]
MSKPRCLLSVLPVELVFECVQYLDTSSVVHLSGTCKRLNSILRRNCTERVTNHALEYIIVEAWKGFGGKVKLDADSIKALLSRARHSGISLWGTKYGHWEDEHRDFIYYLPKSRIEVVVSQRRNSCLESYLSAGLDPNIYLPGYRDEKDDKDNGDNDVNYNGPSSLLHKAIHYKDVEVVKVLLQNGADPRLACTRGGPPGTLERLMNDTWSPCPLMVGVLLDAGALLVSVEFATKLCQIGGSTSSLIELVLNKHLDVHCTYSGVIRITLFTDATILHIAASEGDPDLLEAIISRATKLLQASVMGMTVSSDTRPPPGPRPVPNGQSAEGWYDTYLPLNLALKSHNAANAKYLLQCGSKTDRASFELVWEDACDFTKFTTDWVDILELMAARIEFNSPEAIPMIQRCIEFFFHPKASCDARFFQKLCLPPFLGNMSLRTRARYLNRFDVQSYEADLDELRYIIAWSEVALQNEIHSEGKLGLGATDETTECLPSLLAGFREHEQAQQEIVQLLWEAMLET